MYNMQAKKTYYKGIWFKSSLEQKVAEALDNLGIDWGYEDHKLVDDRFEFGCYTPDFYLPEMSTFIEVAGNWDYRHQKQAIVFHKVMEEAGSPVLDLETFDDCEDTVIYINIDGDGNINDIRSNGNLITKDLFISQCSKCGRYSFMSNCGWWKCHRCGAYDGNSYLHLPNVNLFNAAKETR